MGAAGQNWVRRLPVLALAAAMGVTLALGGMWLTAHRAAGPPAAAADGAGQDGAPAPDPLYVVLLGVDERDGDIGRSDTNLLVRLDPASGRAGVLSLPRDTRVWIPGVGWDKLNAAYAHGGPVLAAETVAAFTGLPVEHYVRVDVAGLRELVDLVGGVEYDVEKRMRYSDPYQGLTIRLDPGLQRLDGEGAMEYLRFRHDPEGDMGRVRRQQRFLRALAGQVLTPATLPRLPDLLATARRHVVTNLPAGLQLQAVRLAYLAQGQGIDFVTVPGEGRYVGPVSYYVHDEDALAALLARWSAGLPAAGVS